MRRKASNRCRPQRLVQAALLRVTEIQSLGMAEANRHPALAKWACAPGQHGTASPGGIATRARIVVPCHTKVTPALGCGWDRQAAVLARAAVASAAIPAVRAGASGSARLSDVRSGLVVVAAMMCDPVVADRSDVRLSITANGTKNHRCHDSNYYAQRNPSHFTG